MADVVPTSIYLNEHDREMLAELKERFGLNRTQTIRLALQRLYVSEMERKDRLLEIAEEIKQLA